LACLLGSALLAASASELRADTAETLQGAWVRDSSDCNAVFEKAQGRIQFKDRTFAADSGFIIAGSKGKGPAGGSCTLSQVEQQGDQFSGLLQCTDGLVSRDFSMTFRIIDATHFERLDPTRHSPILFKKCEL
jgi:hypothetical protein